MFRKAFPRLRPLVPAAVLASLVFSGAQQTLPAQAVSSQAPVAAASDTVSPALPVATKDPADQRRAYRARRAHRARAAHEETASKDDLVQLDKFVVTASGFEQTLANSPASISVISQVELAAKPFVTLVDAVKDMPGVTITNSKSGNDISLRGMTSDYTLILVDGKRQNSRQMRPNGFGEAETGFFPPLGAIERIELVRGPMSTLYGSDAMGGVVNIITRKVANAWGGSLGGNYTAQLDHRLGDESSGDIYANGPLLPNTLGLAVFGRYYHRDEDDLAVPGNSPGRHGARKTDTSTIGARLSYTPTPEHDIILEGGASRQRLEGTPGKTGSMGTTITTADSPYDPVLRFNRDYASLSHTGRWAIGTSDIAVHYEDAETLGRNVSIVKSGTTTKYTVPRTLEIQNLVADAKMHLPLPKNNLTLGAQYIDSEGHDGVAYDVDHPRPDGTYPNKTLSMRQYSLFAEDEFRLLAPLALTGGVRYDHHDAFGGQVSPRAYLVWNTTRHLTLKGGVSTGFKTPTLTQTTAGLSGIGGQGTLPLLGNPDLKPETSTNYEAGVSLVINHTLNLTLTGFYNKFDDKIGSKTVLRGSDEFNKYLDPDAWSRDGSMSINIDTAETRGFEAGGSYRFLKNWKLNAHYTFVESEQTSGTNKGKPLNAMPKHHANGTLSWDITPEVGVWMRGAWYGTQWRDVGDDYKDYALFDIGATWSLNQWVKLNAGIYNLFDKELHDTNTYSTISDNRRLWAGLTITF
ncbi:MAG: TonB-dependent receptor [Opitutaceae bacterium]|jgi:outer membrane receptor for ferrienterochelin and colicins|nr:TonB-dependent receptor [Opitutaceae bacterium]